MDPLEVAYCAGLFEGEGCLTRKTTYRGRKAFYFYLTINMTDLEPLERFQRCMGGGINGPYDRTKYGKGYKPRWDYALCAQAEVEKAVLAMYPYMSPRRRAKMDEFLGYRSVQRVMEDVNGYIATTTADTAISLPLRAVNK